MILISAFLISYLPVAWGQEQKSISEVHLSGEIGKCLRLLGSGYSISGKIKPSLLRGDFDGDGKLDYAVLTVHNGQQRIAICRSAAPKPVLLGAGSSFHQMRDMNFDAWQIHVKKRPVERGVEEGKPPVLLGDAILIEWHESASAILYWNGTHFVWYQQGD